MRRSGAFAGFQRLEAVGLVAVLAILAGVVAPMARDEMGITRTMRAQNDLGAIAGAFDRYREHEGEWPSCADANRPGRSVAVSRFACLFEPPVGAKGWRGPYLRTAERAPRRAAPGGADALPLHAVADLSTRVRLDPWGGEYRALWPREGRSARAIVLASVGPNGLLETTLDAAAAGRAGGDDRIEVVRAR